MPNFLCYLTLISALCTSCSSEGPPTNQGSKPKTVIEPTEEGPEREGDMKRAQKVSADLASPNLEEPEGLIVSGEEGVAQSVAPIDDVARWISGLTPRGQSVPQALIEHPRWQKHAQELDQLWAATMVPMLKKVSAWSQEHLKPLDRRPVFYPFSGPDLLNALHLYPHSDRYLMIALESEGAIPPQPNPHDKTLWRALRTLQNYVIGHAFRNFFITQEMKGKAKVSALGTYAYTGISSVILFFLVRSGHEILSVKPVTLTASGKLIERPSSSAPTPPQVSGVEVSFKRHASDTLAPVTHEQRVIFLKANLSDTNIATELGLLSFILSLGELNSLVKAASYLMHYSNFDSIRNLLLSRSRHIVTDDSGVPYHFFTENPEEWSLALYGAYTRPNPGSKSFAKHCQPDLKVAMKAEGKGKLPFRFGYFLKQPTLISAARKVDITEPVIDFDLYQGTSTVYSGDKRCVKGKQHIIKRRAPKPAGKTGRWR